MTAPPSPIEPPFALRREDEAGVIVLVVEGDVDLVSAPLLGKELESIPAERKVVVDLCETRFMDSTGLRILLAAKGAYDGRVRIAFTPAGPVGRLFDVTLAGELLPIYASRAEALADL